jgi:hypothetical protein
MHVYVGDDKEPSTSTDLPEFTEVAPIEPDNAGLKCMGIEVVIQNEVGDAGDAALAMAEQESTTLAARVSAALP